MIRMRNNSTINVFLWSYFPNVIFNWREKLMMKDEDHIQSIEITRQFKAKKRRQYIWFLLMIILIILGKFPTFDHGRSGEAGVLIQVISWLIPLAGIGIFVYALYFDWRCPKCGGWLGKSILPKYCPHCGVALDTKGITEDN